MRSMKRAKKGDGPSPRVAVVLDRPTFEAIKRISEDEGRTMSSVVARIVEASVEATRNRGIKQ